MVACLLLWLGLRALESRSVGWVLSAGVAACIALLLKLEFCSACYGFLFLLVAARVFQYKSGKKLFFDLMATLPGIVVCALVIAWMMISLRGVEFITQENLMMSWPMSYFMRTYGTRWLGISVGIGGKLTPNAISLALLSAFSFMLAFRR